MKAIARRSVRSAAVLVVALVVGFAFSTVAKAAPGDLDPTFSGDGKQTSNFGPGFSGASAIVRQPDGKIVAVGANAAHSGGFALTRYNPDGSLDPSFSGDGKQTTDFGGRTGRGGGPPARRQDRRGGRRRPASPSPATTPTARSTRASPATASKRRASAGL